MGIYIVLYFIPIILGLMVQNRNVEVKNKRISLCFFTFLMVLFVLRDFSVGSDIPGYEEAYSNVPYYKWFDSDWIYMEGGFIFFMKLCSTIGLSFRAFLLISYLMLVIPLGCFLAKYSKDISLSLVIYVCFQFFVFNMSGLRQSIGIGICIWAFLIAQTNGKKAFVYYCLLIALATLIHRSSIIFLPCYFLMRKVLDNKMVVLYTVAGAVLFSLKMAVLIYMQQEGLTKYEYNEETTIGSSFLFVVLILLWSMFLNNGIVGTNTFLSMKRSVFAKPRKIDLSMSNYANLISCGALIMLAFSGTTMMRGSMNYLIFILALLPNMVCGLSSSLRTTVRIGLMVLMFVIFYTTVLLPSQFKIVPFVWGDFF